MRTSKLLVGALVALLGLSTVASCAKEDPKPQAPTTDEEKNELADQLIKRVFIDSEFYQQATSTFALPAEVLDGEVAFPITWTSDNETNAAVKDGKCVIVRPEFKDENIAFTLTAKINVYGMERTKTFEGFVMKEENIMKVNNVGEIYKALKDKTLEIEDRPVELKTYIVQQVPSGFYIRSSESDRSFYVYGKNIMKDNGLEVGDPITVKGPIATHGGYQFHYKTVEVNPAKGDKVTFGLPAAPKNYTPAELSEIKVEDFGHELYGTKFTIEGKVKSEKRGEYTDYFLETPEGKTKVQLAYDSSNKDVFNTLDSKVGQTVKYEVAYSCFNYGNHQLAILSEPKAA